MEDLDNLLNVLQGSQPLQPRSKSVSELPPPENAFDDPELDFLRDIPATSDSSSHRESLDFDTSYNSKLSNALLQSRRNLSSSHNLTEPSNGLSAQIRAAHNQNKLASAHSLFGSNPAVQTEPVHSRICAVCDQPIQRGGVGLRGRYYHGEHFVCSEVSCRRNLHGVLCFDNDGQLYCERDYHKKFSPPCAFCKEPIKDVISPVEALGKTFHRDHFFCSHCGKTFEANHVFHEYEGKAYCEEDYASLFASRCARCQLPIVGDHAKALKRNWHLDCLKCSELTCQKVLSGGGVYEYRGEPFCEFHYYQNGDNICAGCQKPIIGRCVVAIDKKYHPIHFNCSFCQTPLEGSASGFKEKKGKPYCGGCYIKLFC